MRICKIWDADYPWDVRVEKIADSLISMGHDVHLVCRNQGRAAVNEYVGGMHIHRLPKMTGGWSGALGFPFFFNPIWLRTIAKVVSEYRIEILLVRDLPMALAGVLIGAMKSIPCVLDMAEPYPEMLDGYCQLQRQSLGRRFINGIVRNRQFASFVEVVACRYLDHVFTVSPEISANLITKGVDPSKLSVLLNTPRLEELEELEEGERQRQDDVGVGRNEILRVVYVGDLTEARGVPQAVHAIQKLVRGGEQFQLVIIGKGRYENEIREHVRRGRLQQCVEFVGFVPHVQLANHLQRCDIGIIPHVGTKHNNLTLPNKVFDYMGIGLPIVSADLKPIARVVLENECGLIYRHDQPDSLVETLLALKDARLRRRFGQNGWNAVREKYNWNRDCQELVIRLEELCNRASCKA